MQAALAAGFGVETTSAFCTEPSLPMMRSSSTLPLICLRRSALRRGEARFVGCGSESSWLLLIMSPPPSEPVPPGVPPMTPLPNPTPEPNPPPSPPMPESAEPRSLKLTAASAGAALAAGWFSSRKSGISCFTSSTGSSSFSLGSSSSFFSSFLSSSTTSMSSFFAAACSGLGMRMPPKRMTKACSPSAARNPRKACFMTGVRAGSYFRSTEWAILVKPTFRASSSTVTMCL